MTHNIEGHERSNNSCQQLIAKFKPDFFLRQEDWLFGYQHFKLSQVNSNYVGLGMSVDYHNPVFISGKEKAKWGLDILFTKEMNSFVSTLADYSSNRIQTVKLSLEIPVILVNVYLPASSLPQEEYEESLNLLSAIITRFEAEAVILVSGDFNRSLYRKNNGDIKFQHFCKSVGLIPAAGTSSVPSYHGYNGSTSKIDYVMLHKNSGRQFGVCENNVRISFQVCKEENTDIISTHDAIYFELDIPVNPVHQEDKPVIASVSVQNKKLLWETANIDLYQETLETLLEQNFTFWNQPECIQTLALLVPRHISKLQTLLSLQNK